MMRITVWAGAALGGLALAALAPTSATASPLDVMAGKLLDSPCTYVQVERALNDARMTAPTESARAAARELSGQLEAVGPVMRLQLQQGYDQPGAPDRIKARKEAFRPFVGKAGRADSTRYGALADHLQATCLSK